MQFTFDQIAWMGREVDRQHASARFVEGMAMGLYRAASLTRETITIEDIHKINYSVTLGGQYGFRVTPVVFRNGGSSCKAHMIQDAVERNMKEIPDLPPHLIDLWIKNFLWIHPYSDGNGRTASILRNWMLGTLDDPTDLPDYGW